MPGTMPRAIFINLDRAAERRRFMEEQGARLGIAMTRFAAVRAEDIPVEQARALNHRWERPLTGAELGCYLSHLAIWREAAAGDGPVLVLEDDVMLSKRLPSVLPRLVALPEVEFLNFESYERKRFVAHPPRPISDGLAVVRVYRDKSGSGAYLLWPAGARRLIERADARGAAPVDAFLHGARALVSWQTEPAQAMQLHLLEARGVMVPIPATSSIQEPRSRLPLRAGNFRFHARRLATQLRLGGEHLMRLFGRRYRIVDIVEGDFDHSRS
ncbi:glycosyltransferase family 25 protein [Aureimonas leprariae]|nr:glycosyltransferase family 25 protein [Aureimonas leprariae]